MLLNRIIYQLTVVDSNLAIGSIYSIMQMNEIQIYFRYLENITLCLKHCVPLNILRLFKINGSADAANIFCMLLEGLHSNFIQVYTKCDLYLLRLDGMKQQFQAF